MAVPPWLDPFLPNLERCRGFDSLHATLAVVVVFLCFVLWRLREIAAAEERDECSDAKPKQPA